MENKIIIVKMENGNTWFAMGIAGNGPRAANTWTNVAQNAKAYPAKSEKRLVAQARKAGDDVVAVEAEAILAAFAA